MKAVFGRSTESVGGHIVTLCEFGGDENAASGQTVGRDGYGQRGRQEPIQQGDRQGEHCLVAAALTAHLEREKM